MNSPIFYPTDPRSHPIPSSSSKKPVSSAVGHTDMRPTQVWEVTCTEPGYCAPAPIGPLYPRALTRETLTREYFGVPVTMSGEWLEEELHWERRLRDQALTALEHVKKEPTC